MTLKSSMDKWLSNNLKPLSASAHQSVLKLTGRDSIALAKRAEQVDRALSANPDVILRLKPHEQTPERIMAAIKSKPSLIKRIPEESITEEMAYFIARSHSELFVHLPQAIHSEDLYKALLNAHPEGIGFIAREAQTRHIAITYARHSNVRPWEVERNIRPDLITDEVRCFELMKARIYIEGYPYPNAYSSEPVENEYDYGWSDWDDENPSMSVVKYRLEDVQRLIHYGIEHQIFDRLEGKSVDTLFKKVICEDSNEYPTYLHFEAIARLEKMDIKSLVPFITNEKRANVCKHIFGAEEVLKHYQNKKLAREWLCNDLGI